jgi:hypothetical protein
VNSTGRSEPAGASEICIGKAQFHQGPGDDADILRPRCRLSDARQTIGLFVGPCPTSAIGERRPDSLRGGNPSFVPAPRNGQVILPYTACRRRPVKSAVQLAKLDGDVLSLNTTASSRPVAECVPLSSHRPGIVAGRESPIIGIVGCCARNERPTWLRRQVPPGSGL